MAAKKVILFVEGESNSPNGDLRQGFSKLLEKKLSGKLPAIILGDGKNQAIDKFKTHRRPCDFALLLLDLDKPEDERENDLQANGLLPKRNDVFYMIQEMESWFLSQPTILDDFYGSDTNGKKISEKLPRRKVTAIANPDEELQKLTKNTRKGVYHKIRDGVELLKRLNADQLIKDFADFKRLIERLEDK